MDRREGIRSGAAHRIPKMAEVIAGELRQRILEGALRPGESLYSEASLMEMYAVSRPTIREALRLLESQRLVVIRRGSHRGPIVHLPDAGVTAESMAIQLQLRRASVADLYDFRTSFEPTAARRVAARADASDRARLLAQIDDAEAVIGDPAAFAAASWRFHQELVDLAGNPVMAVVAQTLLHLSERHAVRTMLNATDGDLQQRRTIRAHRHFVDLVASGDENAAAEYWTDHLLAVSDVTISQSPEITLASLLG